MTRKTKALSGAAQDAYFRRVLKTYPGLGEEARDRLVRQLRREIAQVRVRPAAREDAEAAKAEAQPLNQPEAPAAPLPEPVASAPATPATPFDPFAPNVVVVLRTAGREAVLAALGAIRDADNLRLLAREQRLSIGDEVSTTTEISAAILAAAERRIANRRAAAGS